MMGKEERPTLLVIDDDPAWRCLYRYQFEDRFEVIEAEDGCDGLQKFESALPDLVIVDLSMPRMDGADFIASLRGRGISTPVIVCTGHGPSARGLERSKVRVVSKSPDLVELDRAVLSLNPAGR
jgi:CheY-like chemotaxis protein